MAAADTIRIHSSDAGWTPDVQIGILCRFIDEMGDYGAQQLNDFLLQEMEREIEIVKTQSRSGPFVRFEFDSDRGGNYSKVGEFKLVPEQLCESVGYERAFQLHTSIDPRHIVHFDTHDVYDADGERVER